MPNPFDWYTIPLADWVQHFVKWMAITFRPFFQTLKWPVAKMLDNVDGALHALPPVLFLVLLFFVAWRIAGRRVALFSVISMALIGFLGAWEPAMTTLSLVLTAVVFCAVVGIPLGILAARSERFESLLRPVMDAMQTTPSFVYLVPIVMLFGVGNVPGVIATVIFALAPIVRLTSLGIRQVPKETVEAAYAFGSSSNQVLWNVQLPLAARTIMAGLNQTLMMCLSMVVIAAMIAAGGLGAMVFQGIGRLNVGLAAVGGIGIVLMAIMLDRITQSMAKPVRHTKRNGKGGLLGRFARGASSQQPVTDVPVAATEKSAERMPVGTGSV